MMSKKLKNILKLLAILACCFAMPRFSVAEEVLMPIEDETPINATISGQNQWSGVSARHTESRQMVIRTDTDWQRLWLDDIGRLPPGPLPADTEAYAIFAGQRNTGGYGVTIHAAIEEANYVRISYSETRPSRYDMVVMMLTSPYAIFLAPDSKKEPVFVAIEAP